MVELKRGFTLELIYQALDRQRVADGVYVAVPLPRRGYMAPHIRDMERLCRRLELGLIFVGFTSKGPHRQRQHRRRDPAEDPHRL